MNGSNASLLNKDTAKMEKDLCLSCQLAEAQAAYACSRKMRLLPHPLLAQVTQLVPVKAARHAGSLPLLKNKHSFLKDWFQGALKHTSLTRYAMRQPVEGYFGQGLLTVLETTQPAKGTVKGFAACSSELIKLRLEESNWLPNLC